jgi:hypothetical protein
MKLLILLCCSLPQQAQGLAPGAGRAAIVQKLYAEEKWEKVIEAAPAASAPAEQDLDRGLALARLERWEEAEAAFHAGLSKAPRDTRFLVELAGVAYKQKNYALARAYLERALKLDPADAYARDFLATIYLLDGNLEAALEHWNRLGKPEIADFRFDPEPNVRATLLDRAIAFSPESILRRDDLRATEARLRNLEIFSTPQFELAPQGEGSFNLLLRANEKNGWGNGRLGSLLSVLRGLPYQTVYPSYANLRRSAINFTGLVRWDAQKRRLSAAFSFPLEQDPRWRMRVFFDGRNENWDISRTLQASGSPLSDLRLVKEEAGVEVRRASNGRWSWTSGVSFAHRSFGNFSGVSNAARPLFTDGFSLDYRAGLDAQLFRSAARRMTLDSGASARIGKVFARPLSGFGKLEGSLAFHWLPLHKGEDYEMTARFRAGRILGLAPFDELYVLGLDRDTDLWLRGTPATRDAKKGDAPIGSAYLLANWELDKIVYQHPFFTVQVGPFLDAGRIRDPSREFVPAGWMWDPGIQCKVRVLGSVTLVLSYGRDLRAGRNAFFANAVP